MELLASLGINLPSFLWHTANFLVLIFILQRILYKPVVGILDQRQRRIRESIDEAERVRLEADRADQEREALLGRTRREVQELLTNATQMAERIQSDARADAQLQAQRIIERAQQEAQADRAQSMTDLRREVANLAVMAAERIISRNLDAQAQRQLVDEFLAERPEPARPTSQPRLETSEVPHLEVSSPDAEPARGRRSTEAGPAEAVRTEGNGQRIVFRPPRTQ